MTRRFAPLSSVRSWAAPAALLALVSAFSYTPATAAPTQGTQGTQETRQSVQAQQAQPLKSKYRADAGLGDCLRTFGGNDTVQVGACTPAAGEYASMRQWEAVDQGNGYVLIKNKYRTDAALGDCLRTFSGNDTVQAGACTPAAGEYTSMRLWKAVDQGNGYVLIKNKYRTDAALGDCLRTFSSNDTVQAGACTPAAGEYTSMRLWNAAAFATGWPTRPVTGQKRALVMATHWNDAAPVDPAPVEQATLGAGAPSLRTYLQEVSGGSLSLTGDMLTGVDLGARPAGCESAAILSAARTAARARGVEPDAYDYLFVDISRHSACAWEGLAAMPGNWILSNGVGHKTWMWTHEFGHSSGFQHSDTLKACPAAGSVTTVSGACTVSGGDDPTDTMGGGGMHLYPVDYRQFAGWVPDSQVPRVTATGSYRLGVLGESGTQEFRVARPDGGFLSLEYRRATPPYDDYVATDPLVNGVIVRIVTTGGTVRNRLVDATPGTSTTDDAPLAAGRTLVDEDADAAVTVCSVGAQGADLRIAVGGTTPPAC
ncbi:MULTISPECIES: RICIN domain-containing protein [unclassified Streptomyces]|uniref:RICIN domain-containing protein n=1 Tax=unclassified Streptomyces TaxID=2593676 RepID=UPI0016563F24|nr:RICIN domain-containing protein [Streptomyces sp. CB02980]MCB8901551.1 RICIN domain-containing protein [Streptomyces sp. CB02980]